jgi:4'-phosphopantetheinyl transferase
VPPLAPGEVHLWGIALEGGEDPPVADLSAAEVERAGRYRFPADRRRFVRTRAALRTLLGAHLTLPASAVVIATAEGGKPQLEPARHPSPLRFNVSHSGELALIALSLDCEVGVDVEAIRPTPLPDDVIARHFSAAERAALAALPAARRRRAFYQIWTLKEAYLKACGDGLRRLPEHVELELAGDAAPALRVLDRPGDERRWRLAVLDVGESHAAALAVGRPARPCRRS